MERYPALALYVRMTYSSWNGDQDRALDTPVYRGPGRGGAPGAGSHGGVTQRVRRSPCRRGSPCRPCGPPRVRDRRRRVGGAPGAARSSASVPARLGQAARRPHDPRDHPALTNFVGPVLLTPEHRLGAFDCGDDALNRWLETKAMHNHAEGGSRTCGADPLAWTL